MISILNHVLGPIMRGPSSSHTAGSFHIGRLARSLLGEEPASAVLTFDPGGSYSKLYREQGADVAFAAGLLGWESTDERYDQALTRLDIRFAVEPLEAPDHPNTVDVRLVGASGGELSLRAKSVGGGAVEITRVGGWPVRLTGDAYDVLVETSSPDKVVRLLGEPVERQTADGMTFLHARRTEPLVGGMPGARNVWRAEPVFFVPKGEPLFGSSAEIVALAEERGWSLGRAALVYEAALLGLPEPDILREVLRRYGVMRASVERGLSGDLPPMQLLRPSAPQMYEAAAEGRLFGGGMHARAAARSMAVMHVNGAMGLVCACPTAGSAGSVPAVMVTLEEEKGVGEDGIAMALLAASAIGLILAIRATFAAEVAGCQVEIGAAGAMAAAAVVEAAGGTPAQACDAAAICFQNTMGSVCDLIQGIVEIPCHTRNAVAASSAFVVADMVLGGYVNPVPLDETIDAVYAVGRAMPASLRCTSLGGLAQTPSGRSMKRLRVLP